MSIINVCLACDDNYAKYAGVVIASVLKNTSAADELHFYILDGGISEENKAKIREISLLAKSEIDFVEVNNQDFCDYLAIKTHEYISIPTYYRLKLPTLLSSVDRVIYLDCDVVVNSSLHDLFNIELGDCIIAGVRDLNKKMLRKNPSYVNAGMLVFDIKKMKENNLEEKFLAWTKEHAATIKTGDQEIINEVVKGQIKVVDDEWNVQSSNFVNRSSYTRKPKIIHYVSNKKPWHWISFSCHRDLYFKYLQFTPWAVSEEEFIRWTAKRRSATRWAYLKYRPLFFLRPRFYYAVYKTYFEDFFKKVFSITDYNETHRIMYVLGIKIKYPKREYLKKKKENPYYYYKENNIDITTLPPADGQLRDIQLANLALLDELDYVCKQSGAKYWLDFGSVLGAVRHKGFIPWDDDIDVGMFRDEYEKIIGIFEQYSRNSDIFAAYAIPEKNNCQCYIKIQHKKCSHLFVDIFPYDRYGAVLNSREEQRRRTLEIKDARAKIQAKSTAQSVEEILKDIEVMRKQVLVDDDTVDNSDFVWGVDFNHAWKNYFSSYDTIFPLGEIVFEGKKYSCVNKIHEYLTEVYGDYMAYPKRIGMGHNMFAKLSSEEKKVVKNLISEVVK